MKIAILGGHYLQNLCQTENVWSCDLPLTIDPRADNSVQRLLVERCPFKPDCVLFGDQSCLPMLTGLEDLEIPVVAYLVDTHLHFWWQRYFAGLFDLVLTAQKDAAASILKHHNNCYWVPLFSRKGDLKQELEKQYDVVFVGTVDAQRNSERVRFLENFARMMPLQVTSGDYREPFNRARIVLNQSAGNDINFRVFEALASGSMLLTDDIGNGLDQLFVNGQHLVAYRKGDVDDAVAKARYFLDHPHERDRIALAGHALVTSSHSLEARSRDFLQLLMIEKDRANKTESPRRRGRKLAAGRTYLSIALCMSDLETLHGNGTYGQRFGWYLQLAEEALQQASKVDENDGTIMQELALLALLQGDYVTAWAYTKISLANNADDAELFQLAARVAACRGWAAEARLFHDKAARLIDQLQSASGDALHVSTLVDKQRFCQDTLKY